MKKLLIWASAALMLAACGNGKKDFDATGTFEATEITVFAEQSGTLVNFNVKEGLDLAAGQEVGLIDTTQLWLRIRQQEAVKRVYQNQKPDRASQVAAIRQQLAKALQEQQRYRELVADGAAPSKFLDDAVSQTEVLQKQLDATVVTLNTQTKTLSSQQEAADVQMEQLKDLLRKCHVKTPIKGTVLEKYVERGEFVPAGKPLFKMADTQNMHMRAYVTSAQLSKLQLGQKVRVTADYGTGEKKQYDGIVSWISGHSEFTPKTILTDDDRSDLVYVVKIAVKNDGYVKIGMYGEVKFLAEK
jgi:HlyD family secretion protein